MNEEKRFSIEASSDLDYEKMVVNINYGLSQFGTLSCDDGLANAKISILDKKNDMILWEFSYSEFIQVLQNSFKKLEEINRVS